MLTQLFAAVLRVASSIPARNKFRVWLFMCVSLIVCKRNNDAGQIPSVEFKNNNTGNCLKRD